VCTLAHIITKKISSLVGFSTHTHSTEWRFQNEYLASDELPHSVVYVGKAFSSSPKKKFILYIKHCKHFRGRCILQLISRVSSVSLVSCETLKAFFRHL
jgi:hypothetical protein